MQKVISCLVPELYTPKKDQDVLIEHLERTLSYDRQPNCVIILGVVMLTFSLFPRSTR